MIIYIISIALQVSGAVLLICNFSLSRKKVIKKFLKSNFTTENNNKLFYDDTSYKDSWRTNILSMIAVIYIFVGYLLDIWAENSKKLWHIELLSIVGLAILIVVITYLAVNIVVKKSKIINKPITMADLNSIQCQPSISAISDEEIINTCK